MLPPYAKRRAEIEGCHMVLGDPDSCCTRNLGHGGSCLDRRPATSAAMVAAALIDYEIMRTLGLLEGSLGSGYSGPLTPPQAKPGDL